MRYGSGATRLARPRTGAEPRAPVRSRSNRRERAVPAATLGSYLTHHWRCLGHSMGYIVKTPFASLMTMAVIGISLALPTGMYVLLKDVQRITAGWGGGVQISLFLKQDVAAGDARRLADKLGTMDGVKTVEYISPARALDEFRRFSGFGHALDALQFNPLPAVLIVHPAPDGGGPGAVQALVRRLRAVPEVDLVNLDMQWVKRLYAIMALARRGVLIVAGLFAVGVLLIVGNTIRLAIENRREEIQVKKLIGATNAFIRRPFLYYGCWYGVLGGSGACLLVNGSIWLMEGPVRRLSSSYGADFDLHPLRAGTALAVLAAATLLGYVGAWLAVGRHLSAIEPS